MTLLDRLNEMQWPLVYKNRLQTDGVLGSLDGDIGIVYFWTAAEKILASHGASKAALNEKHPRISVASNLYSAQTGLNYMLVNMLSNPHIKHIIALGTELPKDPKTNSGASLRAFFNNGVNDDRSFIGNELFSIDDGINVEDARMLREDVTFHDLNANEGTLAEKIAATNNLLDNLPKNDPSRDIVMAELAKPKGGIMPFEGGPALVRGNYVGEVWLKLVFQIMRYGSKSMMEQVPKGEEEKARFVREINGIVAVIDGEDPDNPNIKPYPFMNLSLEGITDYIESQILSPTPPPELKYAYGGKMRSYPAISNWPLRAEQGELFANGARKLVIDQVQEAIDVLNKDLYTKNGVIITWEPAKELTAKRDSSPCAVYVHPIYKDGRLNMNVVFRSHDMYEGWPVNAFGFLGLQKHIAKNLKDEDNEPIKPGILTITSDSAQVYEKNWVDAEKVLNEHYKFHMCVDDPRGNYTLNTEDNNVVLVHLGPDGSPLEEFIDTPRKLRDKISLFGPSDPAHLAYLGWELAKAEVAINNNLQYVQDQPLKEKD